MANGTAEQRIAELEERVKKQQEIIEELLNYKNDVCVGNFEIIKRNFKKINDPYYNSRTHLSVDIETVV